MTDTILSIEPRLPPAVCGVGMYGWELARRWPEPGPRFVHLVVDGAEASRGLLGSGDIFETGGSAAALASRMAEYPGAGVIVHYASRGFQRLGVPLWLWRGLSRWRRRQPDARMVTFHHEVSPRLPMMTRHYFLERIERCVTARIARAANVVATNTREHAARLEKITGRRDVRCLPVPANIPAPPDSDGSFARREARDFVVFGVPLTQLLTVRHFAAELAEWHRAGVLGRLHVIGPSDEKFSPETDALLARTLPADAVVRHGVLGAPQVSAVLSRAGFFLTQSNENDFSKSGTFAAFAAHACAVVSRMKGAGGPFVHLIRPEEVAPAVQRMELGEFARRACALREWYLRESDWPVVAARFAAMFSENDPTA